MSSNKLSDSCEKNFYSFIYKILKYHFPKNAEVWDGTHKDLKFKSNGKRNIHWKLIFKSLLDTALLKNTSCEEWQTLHTMLILISNIQYYMTTKIGGSEEIIKLRSDKDNGRSRFISKCEEKKSTVFRLLKEGIERSPSLNKQSFFLYLEQNATGLQPYDLNNLSTFNASDLQLNENNGSNIYDNFDEEDLNDKFSQKPTEDQTFNPTSTLAREEELVSNDIHPLAYSNDGDEEEKSNFNNIFSTSMSFPSKPLNCFESPFMSQEQNYEEMEEENENWRLHPNISGSKDEKILFLTDQNNALVNENTKLKKENDRLRMMIKNINALSQFKDF